MFKLNFELCGFKTFTFIKTKNIIHKTWPTCLFLRDERTLCRRHLEHILTSGNPQCSTLHIHSSRLQRQRELGGCLLEWINWDSEELQVVSEEGPIIYKLFNISRSKHALNGLFPLFFGCDKSVCGTLGLSMWILDKSRKNIIHWFHMNYLWVRWFFKWIWNGWFKPNSFLMLVEFNCYSKFGKFKLALFSMIKILLKKW